ncbi:hsp90-like protein [Xylaria intraflava]|nr:hsp90-like protein [Xylaria intraflava]
MGSGQGSAGCPQPPQSPPSPASPNSQPASSSVTGHVFPIRSAISVDQSQPTPCVHTRDPSDPDSFSPRRDLSWDGRSSMGKARIISSAPPLSPASPNGKVSATASNSAASSRLSPKKGTLIMPTITITPDSDCVGEKLSSHGRPPVTLNQVGSNEFGDYKDKKPDPTSVGETKTPLTNGQGTQSGDSSTAATGAPKEPLMTARFRHVMTDDGHAIITGFHDTPQLCENEPIHTPGAVQAFGLLVAIRDEGDGEGTDSRFSVRIVSENSRQIIGYSPAELFKLDSFMDIFSEEQADNLLDHIDFIRDDESDVAISGSDVFIISLRPPGAKPIKLWCAVHVNPSHPDLIICEFEPEDDQRHPIRPPDESAPDEPEDTLCQSPTVEELHESTYVSSKPLRVLRSLHKRRGEAGAMHVFNIMSQILEQFASAPNLEKFLKILVGIVKELTGFHRVMIYQFDSAFNGKVVTEIVDPAQTRDLFQGLHFPASDIPKQARELYRLNKVRLLYDRDLESARLVCRTVDDLKNPLDLSHAYLRAMSPIHLKYLANMGVRSSMSISINAFNELWGLIACHSYGPKGMRVSFPIRRMCRMVGDAASQNIERLSYASRLQARRLIVNTMPTDKNPSGYIIASSEDLLKLLDADFGMLSIGDETEVLGKGAQSQESLAMIEYLRLRKFTSVLTTQDISQDFPDLQYPPGFSIISGLLYVPLSVGGHDFIVFFRKSQVREVKWAGNPYEKTTMAGTTGLLEPRSSFKAWHETVIGQCREWSEEQVETATVLCLVYGKFINVWRQKEAALQTSRLTRLLLANSAHEVRTPLNAIINYLEIALEGSLDRETRDNLAKSHSASKSLIYVINDLLDLTKMEEGKDLVKDELMDLPACVSEATAPFKVAAQRKGILFEVIEHQGVPKYVHGDCRRVRQVVTNLTANAMQNTTAGSIKVEFFVIEVLEYRVRLEIIVHDTGCGMSNEQLDKLFQDLEQVSTARDGDAETLDESLDQTGEGRALGLGLAVVARIVCNMDGQLRVKSEEGKGSKFVIQLPFELASGDALEKLDASDAAVNSASDAKSLASVTKTPPPPEANEVLLVDRGSWNPANLSPLPLSRPRSLNEMNSKSSLRSSRSSDVRSNKSDNARSSKRATDHLIDTIQTSFALGEDVQTAIPTQRKNSEKQANYTDASASSLRDTNAPKQPDARIGVVEQPELSPPWSPDTIELPGAIGSLQAAHSQQILSGNTNQEGEADINTPPYENSKRIRVLVAEDDPINMKILTKRLEKAGYKVYPAVNGEECATIYKEKPQDFDVILMDMQMPIVGGLASARLIREFERSDDFARLSASDRRHDHIPIFAVSASLMEKDKAVYTEAGFDGWILKPINFERLNVLLEGITSDELRARCLYEPGEWERGGWFVCRANGVLGS